MSIQRLSNAGQSGYRYKTLIAGITPVASVPVIGEATAVTYSTASVTFTAPGAYAATTFTATSSPGGFTGTSASSPITVSGLSEQTAYTFTVTATNASGTSSPSAASNSITTPSAFTPEGAYDALAAVTLSASASSVAFSGIPNGYKHIELRYFARGTAAGQTYALVSANENTSTSNYTAHDLFSNGTSALASHYGGQSGFAIQKFPGTTSTSGIFGAGILTILDYASTDKYKTGRCLGGQDSSGAGEIDFVSSLWLSTSAITSLSIVPSSGSFAQYSSFALYGVK